MILLEFLLLYYFRCYMTYFLCVTGISLMVYVEALSWLVKGEMSLFALQHLKHNA